MRFTRSKEVLTQWNTSAHLAVADGIASRLHHALGADQPLTGLYEGPEDSGQQTYWCLIASAGWLHEIRAEVAHLSVTHSSHPLTDVHAVDVESGGNHDERTIRVRLRDGQCLEWKWPVSSRAAVVESNPLLDFASDLLRGRVG